MALALAGPVKTLLTKLEKIPVLGNVVGSLKAKAVDYLLNNMSQAGQLFRWTIEAMDFLPEDSVLVDFLWDFAESTMVSVVTNDGDTVEVPMFGLVLLEATDAIESVPVIGCAERGMWSSASADVVVRVDKMGNVDLIDEYFVNGYFDVLAAYTPGGDVEWETELSADVQVVGADRYTGT
jgi:hypothetical protein